MSTCIDIKVAHGVVFGDRLKKLPHECFAFRDLKCHVLDTSVFLRELEKEIERVDRVYQELQARCLEAVTSINEPQYTEKPPQHGITINDAAFIVHQLFEYAVLAVIAAHKVVRKHDYHNADNKLEDIVRRDVLQGRQFYKHIQERSSFFDLLPDLYRKVQHKPYTCVQCKENFPYVMPMDCGSFLCCRCAANAIEKVFTECPSCKRRSNFSPIHYKMMEVPPKPKRKLLFMAIDGLRPDCLMFGAPNLRKWLLSGSFSTMCSIKDSMTVSGPSWTTILTGMSQEQHGILHNQLAEKAVNLKPETFLGELKVLTHCVPLSHAQMSLPVKNRGYTVGCSMATWEGAFNLFGQVSDRDHTFDTDTYEKNDEDASNKAIQLMDMCDVVVVYLDLADEMGHIHGFGPHVPGYMDAVEKIDGNVERILAAVSRSEDEWIVAGTTDHGGTILKDLPAEFCEEYGNLRPTEPKVTNTEDGGIHGLSIRSHTDTWFAVTGKGIPVKEIIPSPTSTDIRSHIMKYMSE
eukprot:m.74109 g.74109  ORF g.74109 m.74109 type:complete len:519 (-) comp12447_c0_seq4:139-1695(-)